MLEELKKSIESRGFDEEMDRVVLNTIYGERDPRLPRKDAFDVYETWLNTSEVSVEEREREGYAAPEQCQQHVIHAIRKGYSALDEISERTCCLPDCTNTPGGPESLMSPLLM
jgi:hypothetical protein